MFWLGVLYLACSWAGAPMCQEGVNLTQAMKKPFGEVLVTGIRHVANLTKELTGDFKLLSEEVANTIRRAEENLKLMEVEVPMEVEESNTIIRRDPVMLSDQPIEERPDLEVEETQHPVIKYVVPPGFLYVCEFCTLNTEVFVLWSYPHSPRNVSLATCEALSDLEAMRKNGTEDYVALGFYVHPSQCSIAVALTPYYPGFKLPQAYIDVYGSGYGLMDAIRIAKETYAILETRRTTSPKQVDT